MVDLLHFNSLLLCLYPGLTSGGGEGTREGDILEDDFVEGEVTFSSVLEINKIIHGLSMTR